MLVGYARVSTTAQDTDMQLRALRKAGVRKVYQEKTSSVGARPEFQKLLGGLQRGDMVTVYKLDRVARSLKDLLSILERLETIGAGFQSLTEPIDTATPAGRLMLQMLGAVAEFERSLIRERSIAGQIASISRGVRWGRPKRLTDEQEADAWALVLLGEPQYQVARTFGVSRPVIARIVEREMGVHRLRRRPVLDKFLALK